VENLNLLFKSPKKIRQPSWLEWLMRYTQDGDRLTVEKTKLSLAVVSERTGSRYVLYQTDITEKIKEENEEKA
jgi:hypothetical protein